MDIRIFCRMGLLLLITTTSLAADIKKWVDQDGQVHFGDLAPHDVDNVVVSPEVITTAPSANKSLKEIMRPGEMRMIRNYERRGKRLIKAKREASKQSRANAKKVASNKKKCSFNRRQQETLKRKLREGVSRSEKNRIETKLARYNRLIGEYCN